MKLIPSSYFMPMLYPYMMNFYHKSNYTLHHVLYTEIYDVGLLEENSKCEYKCISPNLHWYSSPLFYLHVLRTCVSHAQLPPCIFCVVSGNETSFLNEVIVSVLVLKFKAGEFTLLGPQFSHLSNGPDCFWNPLLLSQLADLWENPCFQHNVSFLLHSTILQLQKIAR